MPALLTVGSSVMTLVACESVPIGDQVGVARRAALDGATLVLLDAAGAESGRFVRG